MKYKYDLRKERIPLPFGQKGEQQEIDLWRGLCSDAAFRDDIKKTQLVLDARYWRDLSELQTVMQRLNEQLHDACKKVLNAHPHALVSVRLPRVKLRHEIEIQRLAKKWALDDLDEVDRWLEHVIRFWNPDSGELPPSRVFPKYVSLVPTDRDPPEPVRVPLAPIFKAVTASVEYRVPVGGKGSPPKALRATMRFRPGISVREAQQAAAALVKCLGVKPMGHRPGLTDYDRGLLRMYFQWNKGLLQKPQSRTQVIEGAVNQMKEWRRPVSPTRVGNELRRWLIENGYRVRRYITERQDSRT